MKVMSVLALLVLIGCSASPTLEELEDEAIVTGDWSAVEERERLLARKRKHQAPDCPSGFASTCYEVGLKVECGCVRVVSGRRIR